jgi:hypothetical protein
MIKLLDNICVVFTTDFIQCERFWKCSRGGKCRLSRHENASVNLPLMLRTTITDSPRPPSNSKFYVPFLGLQC